MDEIKAFEHQQYMNVETYRKSGATVQTPVWFVEVNGELLGDWYSGTARFLSAEETPLVDKFFSRKYGFQKFLFGLLGKLQRRERVFLGIRVTTL